MMIFDSSLGIDFRKHHLILTYLKRSFGKIRLVDFGVHPLLPESQKEEREAQSISLDQLLHFETSDPPGPGFDRDPERKGHHSLCHISRGDQREPEKGSGI